MVRSHGRSAGMGQWVAYDGDLYRNVQLLYDIFSDNLILKYLRRDGFLSLVQLDRERVDSFEVYEHHFKKFDITDVNARLVPGFFDVLYTSPDLSVVAKRAKETHVITISQVEYEPADRFYLIDNGRWTRLTGPAGFYALLQTKEQRKSCLLLSGQTVLNSARSETEIFKRSLHFVRGCVTMCK